jgi:cation transport protein ChaC
MSVRRPALTPDLVARVHRDIEDSGPLPGFVELTDADYDAIAADLLARAARPDDLLVFACGSLIWKPACAIDGQQPALLRGWHRKFCLRLRRWRGTADRHGLMMALDRGGACRGVVQRLRGADVGARIGELLRREMSTKPSTQMPRWVTVESDGARVPALAFCINRNGPSYCGDLALDEVAEILSHACGHWGSGAEYLMNTVDHLERLGIHDRYLWQLQERVAAHIRANDGG